MRVSFSVPGPPEGKRRPRVDTRRGFAHVHPAQADIDRERVIRAQARLAMGRRQPFQGAVRVTVEAVFEPAPSWSAKKRTATLAEVYHTSKPDGDNVLKSVLDALNPDKRAKAEHDQAPFCLVDDAQVAEQLIRKRWGEPARTEITIETITAGLL